MKSTAIFTLIAVFFLSVHVAVDHSGLVGVHNSADLVCEHSHDDCEDDGAQGEPQGVPCEDNHTVAFVRNSLTNEIGIAHSGPSAFAAVVPIYAMDVSTIRFGLSPTRSNPILRPPVLILTHSLLI